MKLSESDVFNLDVSLFSFTQDLKGAFNGTFRPKQLVFRGAYCFEKGAMVAESIEVSECIQNGV